MKFGDDLERIALGHRGEIITAPQMPSPPLWPKYVYRTNRQKKRDAAKKAFQEARRAAGYGPVEERKK